MIRMAVVWGLCVALALGAPALVYAGEMIVNGTFQYSGPSTSFTNGLGSYARVPNIEGWTIGRGSGNASYLSIYEGHDYVPVPIFDNKNPPSGSGGTYTGGWDPGYTGNILSIDGDSTFHTDVYQTVTGLNVGDTYTLSFDYAYGQQQGSPGVITGIHGIVYWGSDRYDTDSANLYFPPQFDGWHTFTQTLVANATSEELFFTATAAGDPPVMLLANVSLTSSDTSAVPEPSSFGLGAVALCCIAAYKTRRRSIRAATEV
jgi:hypothetical protein